MKEQSQRFFVKINRNDKSEIKTPHWRTAS